MSYWRPGQSAPVLSTPRASLPIALARRKLLYALESTGVVVLAAEAGGFRAVTELGRAVTAMAEGEVLQLQRAGNLATSLDAYLEMMDLEGCPLPWFSAVPGGDLLATPVARATLERGGHLRVGLEDHFGDRQPSNVELMREAVALCETVGRPVATPRQAREILGMATKG